MRRLIFIIVLFLHLPSHHAAGQSSIYHEGWIDHNKNGRKDIFEDPSQPVEKRVSDLLSKMTIDEKTAQLATLYGYGRVLKDSLPTAEWKNSLWKDGIANIDEHLNNTTFRKQTRKIGRAHV